MKKTILIGLMTCLLILPMIKADIMIPTVTKVYFEENGQPYNDSVEFKIDCYGYATGHPGSLGFNLDKKPGTYTPENVFSLKATVKNYGDPIYEEYYMNYRYVDYCNMVGETKKGKFSIENYSTSPINFSMCSDFYQIIMSDQTGDYADTPEYDSCTKNIEDIKKNYKPTYGPAANEKVGSTRKDSNGNTWTKQSDGMWASNDNYTYSSTSCDPQNNCVTKNVTTSYSPGTRWGDIVVDEQKGGINYAEALDYASCNRFLRKVLDSELEKDDRGHNIERKCMLKIDLSSTNSSVIPNSAIDTEKGFWEKIGCFFKGIFGGKC